MIIRKEIKELEKLGRLPDESENNLSSETIDLYADLFKSIEKPVNYEEAKILVRLFPESGLFGIEWTLLHLFESIFTQIEESKYIQLMAECPSEEWEKTLRQRLDDKTK